MKTTRVLLFLAGISCFATSCASFPNRRVAEITPAPVSKVNKVSLSYSMTAGYKVMGPRQEVGETAKQQFEKPLVAALDKSGRFSSVNRGKGGAAVHLDVDMLNYGNGGAAMVSGFISGFSLLTIPAIGTDNYKVVATAKSSAGRSRQYVLDDGVTTVIWLPLVFATPFSNPVTVVPKVHENMYRNLIQSMENDGIIPKAAR